MNVIKHYVMYVGDIRKVYVHYLCQNNILIVDYSIGGIKNTILLNKLKLNHDYDISCFDPLYIRTRTHL